MFDHNPFRFVKESTFKTKEDAIKHWNLVHLGDGKYQHASGTGHIFDEQELAHMQRHGVMYDPDPKVRAHYQKIEKEESNAQQ